MKECPVDIRTPGKRPLGSAALIAAWERVGGYAGRASGYMIYSVMHLPHLTIEKGLHNNSNRLALSLAGKFRLSPRANAA